MSLKWNRVKDGPYNNWKAKSYEEGTSYVVYRSGGGWHAETLEVNEYGEEWNFLGRFPKLRIAKQVAEFIEVAKTGEVSAKPKKPTKVRYTKGPANAVLG